MRHPLIRQGEGFAAAHERLRLELEQERQRLNAIVAEVYTDPDAYLSRLGDELQLRGIPALARGVAGAIRGTKPGNAL